MDFQIIPTILTDLADELQHKLTVIAGEVERVQIDIIDEKFADNKTVEVEALGKVHTSLLIDAQLMVDNPIVYLNRCDGVGVERVYGHVEQMPDQGEFVEAAGNLGLQVGLGLDLHTPIIAIEKMLPYLDAVLLMAVEVGFSGEPFSDRVLAKIDQLCEKDFRGDICIDGGLDVDKIALCKEQGANHFAVNSALWGAKDVKKKLAELQRIG